MSRKTEGQPGTRWWWQPGLPRRHEAGGDTRPAAFARKPQTPVPRRPRPRAVPGRPGPNSPTRFSPPGAVWAGSPRRVQVPGAKPPSREAQAAGGLGPGRRPVHGDRTALGTGTRPRGRAGLRPSARSGPRLPAPRRPVRSAFLPDRPPERRPPRAEGLGCGSGWGGRSASAGPAFRRGAGDRSVFGPACLVTRTVTTCVLAGCAGVSPSPEGTPARSGGSRPPEAPPPGQIPSLPSQAGLGASLGGPPGIPASSEQMGGHDTAASLLPPSPRPPRDVPGSVGSPGLLGLWLRGRGPSANPFPT